MTKNEIIKLISQTTHSSENVVKSNLEAFFSLIGYTLKVGGEIDIEDFGGFSLNQEIKSSKNPQSEEGEQNKEDIQISFKPDIAFKKIIGLKRLP